MVSALNSFLGTIRNCLPTNSNNKKTNLQIIHERFGPMAPQETVDYIIQNYFSVYQKNLLKVDEPVLKQMEQVIRRVMVGRNIATAWSGAIIGNNGVSLDATHREIGDEELLKTALTAQFLFDRELVKLKKIDRYQSLYHGKLMPELNLIKKMEAYQKSYWKSYCPCAIRFTATERAFFHELEEKAKGSGQSFDSVLLSSYYQRIDLQREILRRIDVLKGQTDGGPWIHPDSAQLRLLLRESEAQRQNSIHVSSGIHPSLKNHYVMAFGDPISEQGKFVIVKKPEGISDESWSGFISSEGTRRLTQDLKRMGVFATRRPNEVFHIPYTDPRIPDKQWQVEVCYENAPQTLGFQEERDLKMKTRRTVTETGYERTNKPDKESFWKDLVRKWDDNWSVNREATAGVDCHEAITLSRRMITQVLYGLAPQLPQEKCQHIGEYFEALADNDAAQLKGSYLQYEPFLQAQRIQTFIHENMKTNFYPAGTIIPYLESGVGKDYSWKKDKARIFLLTADLFESYRGWSRNLSLFLAEMKKNENQKVAEGIGKETLALIPSFIESLNQFLDKATPPEIQQILAARNALVEKYDRIQADLIRQRDTFARDHLGDIVKINAEVERIGAEQRSCNVSKALELDRLWSGWMEGRRSADIDRVLSGTLTSYAKTLKEFTPSLILMNVPFTSNQRQREIEATMRDRPELLKLYQMAIPPIWQNKVKVQTLIQGELMRGTELSPLWMQLADTMEVNDAELIKNEFVRSSLAKDYLASFT